MIAVVVMLRFTSQVAGSNLDHNEAFLVDQITMADHTCLSGTENPKQLANKTIKVANKDQGTDSSNKHKSHCHAVHSCCSLLIAPISKDFTLEIHPTIDSMVTNNNFFGQDYLSSIFRPPISA